MDLKTLCNLFVILQICQSNYPNLVIISLIKIMQAVKKKVVFILGGPGSGKGTQCDLIVKKYLVEITSKNFKDRTYLHLLKILMLYKFKMGI